MAKVTGKDVLLDLMDEVKRLGEAQRRQELATQRLETRVDLIAEHTRELAHRFDGMTQQMGQMATHMSTLTVRMDGLTQQMNNLTQQMSSVTQQMNSVTQQMNTTTEHFGVVLVEVRSYSDEMTGLRRDFTELSAAQGDFGAGLKRLSALLVKALGTTEDRFDELESRVVKLEKKSA